MSSKQRTRLTDLPVGTYRARGIGLGHRLSRNKNDVFVWQFQILGPEQEGRFLFRRQTLTAPGTRAFWKEFEMCGLERQAKLNHACVLALDERLPDLSFELKVRYREDNLNPEKKWLDVCLESVEAAEGSLKRSEFYDKRIDSVARAAIAYATRGWKIFPVHSVEMLGGKIFCTCNDGTKCKSLGKHPVFKGWQESATSDPVIAAEVFYETCPGYNVGLATGVASGLFVLDIDAKSGGYEQLEALEEDLPDTLTQRTGGGGEHRFFLHPGEGKKISNPASLLPGIDIRGDGGLAILPPSVHRGGNEYYWCGGEPGEVVIAQPPDRLLKMIEEGGREPSGANGHGLFRMPDAVSEGGRNDALFRLCCSRRSKGLETEEILAAAREANTSCCRPPLDDDEVIKIVESAGKYPAGDTSEPDESPPLSEEMEVEILEEVAKAPDVAIEKLLGSLERMRAIAMLFIDDRRRFEAFSLKLKKVKSVTHGLVRSVSSAAKAIAKPIIAERREKQDAESAERHKEMCERKRALLGKTRAGETPKYEWTKDLDECTKTAWKILDESNHPPYLFLYGGSITRLERDPEQRLVVSRANKDRLRNSLASVSRWYVVVKTKAGPEEVEIPPPMDIIANLLATPADQMPLPALRRVVTAPVFAASGKLVSQPGYHESTGLFLEVPDGFKVQIPLSPSQADISGAKSLLLDQLMRDFPFVSEADSANALACFLLPYVRDMITGPTPLHDFEAPSAGSGKTLLVQCGMYPFLGAPCAALTEGRDDDEWRKRLSAKLVTAPSVLFLDNIRNKVDTGQLAAALTTGVWEDRILGATEMLRVEINCVWIMTANNPRFSSEMARRTVRIRIDPQVEQPFLRDSFEIPELNEWVVEHRADLVSAYLTLVAAWVSARRPPGPKSLGMFEGWARTMSGILECVEVKGFLENAGKLYAEADEETRQWRAFAELWWDKHGGNLVRTRELYELVEDDPIFDLGRGDDQSRKVRLGKLLQSAADRPIGTWRIERTGSNTSGGVVLWRLDTVEQVNGRGGPSSRSTDVAENRGSCETAEDHKGRQ